MRFTYPSFPGSLWQVRQETELWEEVSQLFTDGAISWHDIQNFGREVYLNPAQVKRANPAITTPIAANLLAVKALLNCTILSSDRAGHSAGLVPT